MTQWKVDRAVQDLIEYFDEERRRYRWDALTSREIEVITNEVRKCRASFEYAARNYFRITDKYRREVPFRLWESQELILEKLNELRAKGRPQKLMILKARQLGCCLAPHTPVLNPDLSWRELDSVVEGDHLVGAVLIEEADIIIPTRAVVEAVRRLRRDAYRISLANGRSLIATAEHRFLVRKARDGSVGWYALNEPIGVGDEICYIAEWMARALAVAPRPWFDVDIADENHPPQWVPITAVKELGEREVIDIQTSSGTFIADGFVSHNSTLIEALIAWRTMFFENTEALVVSVDKSHSGYLFDIMLYIVDRMPWWLRPQIASRRFEDGLWFANPDPEERRYRPGLNSRVVVQAANQYSGIGQGRRINAAHISEGANWNQRIHRMAMEGDLAYALVDSPDTIAVWESTAKGAGTYTERLWLSMVKLGENAEWYPLFLPWFLEKRRVMAPPEGWEIPDKERALAERVADDWCRCDNADCGAVRQNHPMKGVTLVGTTCPSCNTGTLVPYRLSREQLCWIWHQRINKEEKGLDAVKELRAEMCSTPEEAFQIHGIHVFPEECWEWVRSNVSSPISIGDFDEKGNYHGYDPRRGRCYQTWCAKDHLDDLVGNMEIWEFPEPGAEYVVGVDVAEGNLGPDSDYSVAFVNRVGRNGEPEAQVAMYRTREIDPVTFARFVTWIGYMYNTAMLSIEYNGIGAACADTVRVNLAYPNLYRWKHLDSDRMDSNKWHWMTQYNTKPKLWQMAVRWLMSRMWVVRSAVFYEEMIRFQKEDYSDRSASAEEGWHDDVLMAGMIALYTAHDTDTEDVVRAAMSAKATVPMGTGSWRMSCQRCNHTWRVERVDNERECPNCGSLWIGGVKEDAQPAEGVADFEKYLQEVGNEEVPDYAVL